MRINLDEKILTCNVYVSHNENEVFVSESNIWVCNKICCWNDGHALQDVTVLWSLPK